MWYEILPNGKCKFNERYFDEMTGKDKYVSITMDSYSSKNQKAVQKVLNDRISKKLSESSSEVDNLTFGVLVDKYLAYQLLNVKKSTSADAAQMSTGPPSQGFPSPLLQTWPPHYVHLASYPLLSEGHPDSGLILHMAVSRVHTAFKRNLLFYVFYKLRCYEVQVIDHH